jgi:predicted aldo/keto reductase-like oxidoreductase
VRYKKLKRTGLKASVLACGSHIYPIGEFQGLTQEQCNTVYNYALDNGINTIVTNTAYKTVEDMLYNAIGKRRDEYNLSVGTDHRSARLATKDIDSSLRRFKTSYIEIYQMSGIRRVDTVDRALRSDGALHALLEAKKEGKIGHIGITGHNIDALVKAIKTGHIECCQFVFNMAQKRALTKLITVAKEFDVDLFVMRPLEDGWLKGQAHRAMRFLFSSPIDVVISGMLTPKDIDANLAIAQSEPTAEEWKTLLEEVNMQVDSECEGCMLCKGHWVDYDGTACPKGIEIYDLLIIRNFRKQYALSEDQEKRYRACVDRIKACNGCNRCEAICIYNVPIVERLKEISREFET